MSDLILSSDVVIRRDRSDAWILTNLRVHRHLEIDPKAMTAVMKLSSGGSEMDWAQELETASGYDRSAFSNAEGLMKDPTGFGPKKTGEIRGTALLKALKDSWILHSASGEDYRAFLNLKTSILDTQHLGTFHQMVGQYQVVQLRLKEKWKWWHDQKFTPDGKNLQPGLYQWVQGDFFKKYFSAQNLKGKNLFDFGCGNGFYSRQFKDFGAKVTGIDTSPELIEMAKKNSPGIEFLLPANEKECLSAVENLPPASFDLIYLSDVLLFFFHDLKTHQTINEDLIRLLAGFRKALKPDGSLYLMEPNGAFWLSGWYGNSPMPWTAMTEYRNRLYHVAPTPDTVITALGKAGFLVKEYQHPEIQEWEEGMDATTYSFAKSFPVWDFYRFVRGAD